MKAQDSLNPYNHSIAFAYTPSRVFHNRVIQPDEDLGPDAFHALQKRAYRSETGLNDYDPKKSLDERDCKTYTLKDISRYPGLENLKDESIECTHSGLRELSLLYCMPVNDTV